MGLGYKVLISKWRPSQHQYKKYHRYGGKPPQKFLKKTSKNFLKNALPPLQICESVTLTKYFFYLAKSTRNTLTRNTLTVYPVLSVASSHLWIMLIRATTEEEPGTVVFRIYYFYPRQFDVFVNNQFSCYFRERKLLV